LDMSWFILDLFLGRISYLPPKSSRLLPKMHFQVK
jgi:hypothetical protein